ncbi:DNA-3-methyladenine glycosylase [Rubrobacter xylanophilus]|uniref:DNA-3-methyladenine glycosylase n=1 Tax=Rubrobacter xylanophilus TaxID=49319 RepID=UPI0000551097|nr:DNA-3-methyladenine glycosylase [Rubrobacter xylanophilus]
MSTRETLPTGFYDRDPRAVAVDLLGCVLVSETPEGTCSGVIVETEAYRPEDPACHAYRGPSMRNRTLFGGPGLAYVYLSYGMHRLLNAVCEGEGVGSAVLIRSLAPLEGVPLMRRRRGRAADLCNGPGRLAESLGVGLSLDGHDLTLGEGLYIAPGPPPRGEIVSTTRIGVSRGAELPWRYLVLGERVSVPPRRISGRGLRRAWNVREPA